MMRALFSGISGLRTHQIKMDVIGNNISNVNTVGFKKSTVTFRNQFYETVNAASAPSANNGGTNAKQIGLGTSLSTIATKYTPGNSQYTGNALDLAIDGDGFFILKTPKGDAYTRAGNFALSNNGQLIDSTGNYVLCYGATQALDGTFAANTSGTPVPLKVDKTQVSGIAIDESGAVTGLLLNDVTAADAIAGAGSIDLNAAMHKGEKVVLGYVAIATFNNPEGLDKIANNMFQSNQNSGTPITSLANTSGAGSIIPSSLESSNVDLSEEMVSMIIAQRGFQANSRIITTTDAMLEELVNLKR